MVINEISVISIENQSTITNQEEEEKPEEEIQENKETSAWNMCHIFSVLIVCFVFSVPINFIHRTNSIFYPSKWYEFNFVMMGSILLTAASDILNMATFFKEKSLMSFPVMLRMYSLAYSFFVAIRHANAEKSQYFSSSQSIFFFN